MKNKKIRVVMLCGNAQSSRVMYNALARDVAFECIILERKPSGKSLLLGRVKKIGVLKVTGQLLFLVVNKLLKKASQTKINKLIFDYELNDKDFPDSITSKVDSVNSEEVIGMLKRINPDAVVVNGTRIISKNVLASLAAPFINTHMGITPRYRGVHGGYWALVNGDADNCGVTVHLVDQGIDTGGVLYQDVIRTNSCDNFNTYPIHQIAKAIPLMKAALNDIEKDRIIVQQGALPSRLWSHPTLFEYVKHWMQMGVK